MKDFEDAIERVVAGLEKKNKVINPKEKRIVAYHEAGHAIVSWMMAENDPVQKISIVPRGMSALGYTMNIPLEDRYLMTKKSSGQEFAGSLEEGWQKKLCLAKFQPVPRTTLKKLPA